MEALTPKMGGSALLLLLMLYSPPDPGQADSSGDTGMNTRILSSDTPTPKEL